ncbi:glycosyltransferase [Rhizobium sp. FY34]|uniref:glycosyltransferase n=1 Tax=Rhizobium sp. FY34 TaxID=2562309 RepID=UPI0010BFF9E1|nr:glycosyltransferase [Rhizobium sp. FY34]
MRVLHVAETIRGGITTYFNEILVHQVRAFGPENVRLIVPSDHADELIGFPPESIAGFWRQDRLKGLPFLLWQTFREIRRFRPDVVHLHSTFAGALIRGLAVPLREMPPIVYCPHGWAFDMERAELAKRFIEGTEWLLSRRVHRIIAISRHEYDQGIRIGIPPGKLILAESGITEHLPSVDAAAWDTPLLKVLFVGRLDHQKGFDILIDAIRSHGGEISVRAIGASVNSRDQETWDVPTHVEMLGWQHKDVVTSHLKACDVVVVPSRWEGFGLVAVEAMRAGKPVVAASVGGLAAIIVDRETGLLVPKNDPDALAKALLSRPAQDWAAMGKAGRQRFIRHFTSDRTHTTLAETYDTLIRKSRS